MNNWWEWTRIVLSRNPGDYAGTDWPFGECCCTSPAPIRNDRWEKQETSGVSHWSESCKLITIPWDSFFRKCTCNQFVIRHLWPAGVQPASLCQWGAGGETVLTQKNWVKGRMRRARIAGEIVVLLRKYGETLHYANVLWWHRKSRGRDRFYRKNQTSVGSLM